MPKAIEKAALLCAIGLAKTGKRSVLGFLLSNLENINSWTALLKDLLRRGLNQNAIAMVISDEHKAIISTVDNTLGKTHQLCIIHKMRNALCRVHGQHHQKQFYADFKATYWANSKDDA